MQTFLNTGLDVGSEFPYFVFSILFMGAEFAVYFCAAAIRYMLNKSSKQAKPKKNMTTEERIIFPTMTDKFDEFFGPLSGFHTIEHLLYMNDLQSKYGNRVATHIHKGLGFQHLT